MKQSVELVGMTKPLIEGVEAQDFAAYIARIGRVKANPERLLRYLIENAHWSPLEHTFVTFKIITSRAMGRELLRHRSFTFQELSQRYEAAPEPLQMELRGQAVKNRQSSTEPCDPAIQWKDSACLASEAIDEYLKQGRELYEKLLAAGVARECARFILPECTGTTILMTGSLRSWIHFFAIRDHPNAQLEIQIVAREMKQVFTEKFPAVATAAFAQPPIETEKSPVTSSSTSEKTQNNTA